MSSLGGTHVPARCESANGDSLYAKPLSQAPAPSLAIFGNAQEKDAQMQRSPGRVHRRTVDGSESNVTPQ
jgi:hypothetical protein